MRGILVLFILLSANTLISKDYYVYVAAESDDMVSLLKFDGKDLIEVERFEVGVMPTEIEGPHGITVDPNGKYWYLSLAHGSPYGTLTKYSTETNKPISSTKLGLFPASMQISEATGLLYCVNFNLHGDMVPSTVSVVDPEIMVEIKQIETGAMPHGSRISPDGLFQYSVAMMSGELFEVDAISLKVNRKLSLEKEMSHSHHHMHHDNDMKMVHSKVKPTWVIPHPSKKSVFVAGNGSDEIIEVDLDNWEVINRINVGKGPYNIEISPDGKYLVSTLKGEGSTGVWSLEDISVNRIIKNTTMVSHGIAISPDSKYAFVSVEGIGGEPGKVDVINLENMSLLSSVNVGKQAGGIAFWKISD
ncbi:MAG: hypothetical protein CMB81_05330 [Flammeovirgaceae bacterium]|nr:hypothetical protein [Flammeovirgaceae bacterium]|tara:strand:+ start:1020 stop:2099 length:1080 start_codon:yes stop_codon:yes gene_type:complete